MTKSKYFLTITCMIIATSGCSTRPRQFAATLKTPAADEAAYQNDLAACQTMVGKGYKSNFKATAGVIGAGTVAGTAVAGAATAVAFTSNAGILGGATATSNALLSAVPFVGFAASFGLSRAIRGGREKKVKTATADCLNEYGYTLAGWTKVKKQKKDKKQAKEASAGQTPG